MIPQQYERWASVSTEDRWGHCIQDSDQRPGTAKQDSLLSGARDLEFESKMAQVLYVYKEVEIRQEVGERNRPLVAVLSYNEKPGVQAIENTSPDLVA